MKVRNISLQQSEYLAKVAGGTRLQDIAKQENVSFSTVRHHLNGLKNSMDAETLPELVAKGLQLNIIKPDGQGGFEASNIPKIDDRRNHLLQPKGKING